MKSPEMAQKEIDERGYSLVEMKEIKDRLDAERRDWIRHFDSYVDQLVHDDSSPAASYIVAKAATLADARKHLLLEKFGETE